MHPGDAQIKENGGSSTHCMHVNRFPSNLLPVKGQLLLCLFAFLNANHPFHHQFVMFGSFIEQ